MYKDSNVMWKGVDSKEQLFFFNVPRIT